MKLDFNIDRKSANFDFKNPQNISVDQITFSFHYELDMNFLWNPKDFHSRYELYIALWNRTQNGTDNLVFIISIASLWLNKLTRVIYCNVMYVHCL